MWLWLNLYHVWSQQASPADWTSNFKSKNFLTLNFWYEMHQVLAARSGSRTCYWRHDVAESVCFVTFLLSVPWLLCFCCMAHNRRGKAEEVLCRRSTLYVPSYMNMFASPSAFAKAAVAFAAFEELHLQGMTQVFSTLENDLPIFYIVILRKQCTHESRCCTQELLGLGSLMNFSVLCSRSCYFNHTLAVIPILEILFLNYENTAE